MTIINEFTWGESSAQFSEYVSLLYHLAKKSETTAQERIDKVEQLTEAYFNCRGTAPASAQLDRLASLILRDELTDDTRLNKMSAEEYPLLSDRQRERRHLSEVGLNWSESIAQDGKDWRSKTREYTRKLRLIND